MENLTPEILEKVQKAMLSAKSPGDIAAIAKENGIGISDERAAELFARSQKSGELSDDELGNVTGGGCYNADGYLLTTICYRCEHYVPGSNPIGSPNTCGSCSYWHSYAVYTDIPSMFGIPLVCEHPANRV